MKPIEPAVSGAKMAAAIAMPETAFEAHPSPTARRRHARVQAKPRSVLIYSPQFNTIGGVETHLVRLSCFLARKNCHVTLVTTSGMLEEARVRELTSQGVEFLSPPGGPLSVPRKIAWLAKLAATQLHRRH